MAGNGERGRHRGVLIVFTRHWALWSIAALLILIGFSFFIWWTGMTWLPSLVVAVLALAGYVMSNRQYHEQEARKYRPAITASFQLASDEVRHTLQGWMPGFNLTFEEANPVLKSNFTLENISASPVTDVRMNFYMHDFRESRKPEPFFERDVVVADGIAGNSHSVFTQVLRSHGIYPLGGKADVNGVRGLAFNFHQLFLSLIPSVKPGEPAHLSAWSLVFKYKNLIGESFFSVYKMEGPVVRQESSRMVFHGSFAGDYLSDNDDHGFVNNRGFCSKEDAPNWDDVQESVEAAMLVAQTFISNINNETYCR